MLANAMRGLATGFGLVVPKGMDKLGELVALVEGDETFPARARGVFTGLLEQCRATADRIEDLEAEIVAHARGNDTARRLATVPGIGPITASLLAATVGRHRELQERAALRGLARAGAKPALDRRQNPPWPDHEGGQPRDPKAAGARRHVDGAPRRAVERCRRGVGAGAAGAASCPAGDGGAGEQDGAHRLGADDARRGLPGEGRRRGGCGSSGVTLERAWQAAGANPHDPAASAEQRDGKGCGQAVLGDAAWSTVPRARRHGSAPDTHAHTHDGQRQAPRSRLDVRAQLTGPFPHADHRFRRWWPVRVLYLPRCRSREGGEICVAPLGRPRKEVRYALRLLAVHVS